MKPAVLALTIGSVLLAASLTGLAFVAQPAADETTTTQAHAADQEPGADVQRIEHGMAGDGHDGSGAQGMERPTFPPAEGTTPDASAAQSLDQVRSIVIHGDEGFAPSNGVRSGNGTLDDPYIFSGYYVTGDLYIADTDACIVVKENYIGGQLSLNWNAQCVHVHHNYVEDLRVNENNARTGYATGGLIELNKIEFIGQIRHYDGEFRDNVVGPRGPNSMFDEVMETTPLLAPDLLVANVDGFNQGQFHHNTFYGSVDLDLHGHHHGTGFFAPHSHYHGDNMDRKMPHDHTQRWTSVAFTDNVIIDPDGYGLRYEDRNHRGDDVTANSEQEETLREAHRHYTHIDISRNQIEGGQIWVDVFNANDDLHYDTNPGWLEIVDNTVNFQQTDRDHLLGLFYFGPGSDAASAIYVNTAKEVDLTIVGNTVTYTATSNEDPLNPDLFGQQEQEPAGIHLNGLKTSNIEISDNSIVGFYYGVKAERFDEGVQWDVSGNDFGSASYGVWYDESVSNKPSGGDA